jgi:asparagine synthase (glutamine-hydrolysing)
MTENTVNKWLRWLTLNQLGSPPMVKRVRREKLTYLSTAALCDLHDLANAVGRQGVDGCIIEAGCALGGSAIVLADAKPTETPLHVYDVFGMIPAPEENDGEDVHRRYKLIASGKAAGISGDRYYGYEPDLRNRVIEHFRMLGVPVEQHHVELHTGLFQDTLRLKTPVALAHLDGDWYRSVLTCLERIWPWLIVGGVLVIDDYDAWSGCRRAVDDYFAGRKAEYRFVRRARLHIVKT